MLELQNDDIWDNYLKTATIQNSFKETASYPPIEEIAAIQIPEHFQMCMLQCANRSYRRAIFKTTLRCMRKVAAIAIIIWGIGFAILLQDNEVRAACNDAVMQVYETYIRIIFGSTDANNAEPVSVGYIPKGFDPILNSCEESDGIILYKNAQDETVEICYFKENHIAYIDNEHYTFYKVLVNGMEGTFFEAQDSDFMNILYWNTDKAYFQVNSSLGKIEMIKIAENIN